MPSDLDAALAFSRYATMALAARPHERDDARRDRGRAVRLGSRAEAALAASVDARRSRARWRTTLRRLRRRVFVHTLVRDLTGARGPRRSLRRHDHARRDGAARGRRAASPRPRRRISASRATRTREAQELVIVGMGKLGGRELNVSSDIDLVFVYPEDGETDGARTLSNREFFERLGRRVIGALHEITPEGFVFRVDVRLRPYGESGPLAVPYSALEQYLITQGRAWERYAWLKARALTGGRHDELDALVTPFVFRKYLDFDAYDGLRDIHRQIARAGPAQRLRAEHQARAGRHSRNRVHRAGAAARARRARARAARPRHAARARRRSPNAACSRRRPSPRCATPTCSCAISSTGCSIATTGRRRRCPPRPRSARRSRARWALLGRGAFERDLAAHRAAVSAQFADLFGAARDARRVRAGRALPASRMPLDAAPPTFAAVWGDARRRRAGAGDAGRRRLRGSRGPPRASRCAFAPSPRYLQLPALSRQRVDALVPQLLATRGRRTGRRRGRADGVPSPVRAPRSREPAQRLSRAPDRASGDAAAARAADGRLAVGGRLPDAPPDPARRAARSARAAGRARLGRVAHRARAHAGRRRRRRRAADGRAPPFPPRAIVPPARAGSRRHADRRAPCRPPVRAGRHHPRRDARARSGRTCTTAPRRTPPLKFAIIGFGKLGGKELGYASDLDLVFLYDDADEAAVDRYTRLAGTAHHVAHQRDGRRPPVRHRPAAAAGRRQGRADARRSPAFWRYQREQAWTWEHQALTRARFVAGDATIGAAFEAGREAILRLPRDRDALVARSRRHAAANARGPSQSDRALRSEARRRAAWSTSNSRSST